MGRTARIGKAGSSLLFLLPNERGYLPLLGRYKVLLLYFAYHQLKLEDISAESIFGALVKDFNLMKRKQSKTTYIMDDFALTLLQFGLEKVVDEDEQVSSL